jgi:hypothetical protein
MQTSKLQSLLSHPKSSIISMKSKRSEFTKDSKCLCLLF